MALSYLKANYPGSPEWTLSGLEQHTRKGIAIGLKRWDEVLDGGTYLASQLDLGDCVVDLVFRDAQGRLVVHDDKTHLKLEPRHDHRETESTELMWQLLHGAWRVGLHYGEPVAAVQSLQIALTPSTRAFVTPRVDVTARVPFWLQEAQAIWLAMATERDWPNYRACRDYARACEFYDGCHTLWGDERTWEAIYERRSA